MRLFFAPIFQSWGYYLSSVYKTKFFQTATGQYISVKALVDTGAFRGNFIKGAIIQMDVITKMRELESCLFAVKGVTQTIEENISLTMCCANPDGTATSFLQTSKC